MAPGRRGRDAYRARKRFQRDFPPGDEGAWRQGPLVVAPQAQSGLLELLGEQTEARNIRGPAPPGGREGQNRHFQDVARLRSIHEHRTCHRIDAREIQAADVLYVRRRRELSAGGILYLELERLSGRDSHRRRQAVVPAEVLLMDRMAVGHECTLPWTARPLDSPRHLSLSASRTNMSLEQFGYEDQLDRALSLGDLIVYGMIFMVPIAPFSVFGFVWQDARGMVVLAYLIGLIGMLFTALSYAGMSRAFPLAGSVYAYVQRGLHEIAGFLAGWLILLDYILVPALLYLFSAAALQPLLPAVPSWLWLLGFVIVNAVATLLGVRVTARLYKALLALELLLLAWFIIVGARALYAGCGTGLKLAPLYVPHSFSLSTVASATSIEIGRE